MNEKRIIFRGTVDKEKNPFSRLSWCKEHLKGEETGTGKPMGKNAINDFQIVLEKGGWIKNINEPHYEKYATFQAIRWGYAKVEEERIVATEKWNNIKLNNKELDYSRMGNKREGRNGKLKKRHVKKADKNKTVNYAIESKAELISELKKYAEEQYKSDFLKYLEMDNLILKSPEEIANYTFGSSIARAFRHEKERPSIQFRKWVKTKADINKLIAILDRIECQNDYDKLLFDYAISLSTSWEPLNKKGEKTKMNIGIALKILNLMMKHLYFVNAKGNKNLQAFLHVPWDSFTLRPLYNIWHGYPRITKKATQGFVKTKKQYLELHNFITDIAKEAGVPRIVYEFWGWNKEH